MNNISLREYNHLILESVTDSRFGEAIFHATHILKSYPKCIETYRGLAMALLGEKRLSEAAGVFSKILSVYPDDVLTHMKLSEIYEADDDYAASISHMERAFESQPSNLSIQENLKRLHARQAGNEPVKIRLTYGALVRMYVKGELYQQAISEATSLLETNDQRVDIKLLLAKSYLDSGSEELAISVYDDILASYPYCFEANHMVDKLRYQQENNDKTSINRQRMIEVDPYQAFATTSLTSTEEEPADKILLEFQEYLPGETGYDENENWSEYIGIQNDSISTRNSNNIPAWITDAGWTRASIEDIQAEQPTENSSASAEVDNTPEKSEIPDWVYSILSLDNTELQIEPLSQKNRNAELLPSESIDLGITEPIRISKVTSNVGTATAALPNWLIALENEEIDEITIEDGSEQQGAIIEPEITKLDEKPDLDFEPENFQTNTEEFLSNDNQEPPLFDINKCMEDGSDEHDQYELKEVIPDNFSEEMKLESESEVVEEKPTKEGAISEELNRELLIWLEDIDPDFDPDLDKEETKITNVDETFVSQDETFAVAEESNPHRLSSNQEISAQSIIQSDEEVPTPATYAAGDLNNLLEEGKYLELRSLVKKMSLSEDELRVLEANANVKSEHDPSSFELWKTIGDLNVQLADLDKALEAYRKAENLLFH